MDANIDKPPTTRRFDPRRHRRITGLFDLWLEPGARGGLVLPLKPERPVTARTIADLVRRSGEDANDVRILTADGARHTELFSEVAGLLAHDVLVTPDGAEIRHHDRQGVDGPLHAVPLDRATRRPRDWLVIQPPELATPLPGWFTVESGLVRPRRGVVGLPLRGGLVLATRADFVTRRATAHQLDSASGGLVTVAVTARAGGFLVGDYGGTQRVYNGGQLAALLGDLPLYGSDLRLWLTWPSDPDEQQSLGAQARELAETTGATVWTPPPGGSAELVDGRRDLRALDYAGQPAEWQAHRSRFAAGPAALRTTPDGLLLSASTRPTITVVIPPAPAPATDATDPPPTPPASSAPDAENSASSAPDAESSASSAPDADIADLPKATEPEHDTADPAEVEQAPEPAGKAATDATQTSAEPSAAAIDAPPRPPGSDPAAADPPQTPAPPDPGTADPPQTASGPDQASADPPQTSTPPDLGTTDAPQAPAPPKPAATDPPPAGPDAGAPPRERGVVPTTPLPRPALATEDRRAAGYGPMWLSAGQQVNAEQFEAFVVIPVDTRSVAEGIPTAELFLLAFLDPRSVPEGDRLLRVRVEPGGAIPMEVLQARLPARLQHLRGLREAYLLPAARLDRARAVDTFDMDRAGQLTPAGEGPEASLRIRCASPARSIAGLPNDVRRWPTLSTRRAYALLPANRARLPRHWLRLHRSLPPVRPGRLLLELRVPRNRAIDVTSTADLLTPLTRVRSRAHALRAAEVELILSSRSYRRVRVHRAYRAEAGTWQRVPKLEKGPLSTVVPHLSR
ncbi:hypothetical protein [Micromonospora endophytica]|nr:hypothetical protein [Micromonospora endophytica]